jgi:hypothetical protein
MDVLLSSVVGGFIFSSENIKPLFYERDEIIFHNLQVVRGDDGAVNFLHQQIVARGLGERRIDFFEK